MEKETLPCFSEANKNLYENKIYLNITIESGCDDFEEIMSIILVWGEYLFKEII